MFKYLYCHTCNRGYLPSDWKLPEGTTEADFEKFEHSLRHRACPKGHAFTDPESWQTEAQYQQDREHEARLAAGARTAIEGTK